ncbi:signal-regulatory protein beta-2-like [Enoplosus armatus]|uniref:signal-regulatory protein beta-2-like n=1 Tax=Enoplosus armatus TaxID=215367 RepID=UPI0039927641
MILLWVTLLVLHRGYTLVPVTVVELGEPATFTCALPEELSSRQLYWYKQSAGDTMKLILSMWQSVLPKYEPEFSKSRLKINSDNNFCNLTILQTIQEDEGMYHCAIREWISSEWSGTYLLVKGNRWTSNYTVVQWPTVSDPVRPGDSVTLQCSVFSDSESKMCPGDHSVFWLRAGSDKSHPDIIYTDGNRHDECDKRSASQKSCVYRFSKNVSSSDAGTYHCAVAACGEILFGNGTQIEIDQTTHSVFIAIGVLTVCLVISVVGNVVLICNREVHEQYKGKESAISEARHDNLCQPVHDITEADDNMDYAALSFSEKKNTRGRKKREFADNSVYSQVNRHVEHLI